MTIAEKLKEMEAALDKIKQLMPEVEAQLSLMGGVAATPRKPLDERVEKSFRKSFKRENNFKSIRK